MPIWMSVTAYAKKIGKSRQWVYQLIKKEKVVSRKATVQRFQIMYEEEK